MSSALGMITSSSGIIDVIAIQHEDGNILATPFLVKFNDHQNHQNYYCEMHVNGQFVKEMELDENMEAYFIEYDQTVERHVDTDKEVTIIPAINSTTKPRINTQTRQLDFLIPLKNIPIEKV
jgi:phosphatidate phosphatase PAH1